MNIREYFHKYDKKAKRNTYYSNMFLISTKT